MGLGGYAAELGRRERLEKPLQLGTLDLSRAADLYSAQSSADQKIVDCSPADPENCRDVVQGNQIVIIGPHRGFPSVRAILHL